MVGLNRFICKLGQGALTWCSQSDVDGEHFVCESVVVSEWARQAKVAAQRATCGNTFEAVVLKASDSVGMLS